MAFEFEIVDVEEAQATLARRTRTSKWRENLQKFMDADVAAIRVKTDDDEMKPGSVASGLNNALNTAKNAGQEFPVKVKQSTAVDGTKSVYLIRTDMIDVGNDEDDDEGEGEE